MINLSNLFASIPEGLIFSRRLNSVQSCEVFDAT